MPVPDTVEWRCSMVKDPHKANLLALCRNAGFPALGCYPTWFGFELYLGQEMTAEALFIAGERIPGFVGVRKDQWGYFHLSCICRHPGREQ